LATARSAHTAAEHAVADMQAVVDRDRALREREHTVSATLEGEVADLRAAQSAAQRRLQDTEDIMEARDYKSRVEQETLVRKLQADLAEVQADLAEVNTELTEVNEELTEALRAQAAAQQQCHKLEAELARETNLVDGLRRQLDDARSNELRHSARLSVLEVDASQNEELAARTRDFAAREEDLAAREQAFKEQAGELEALREEVDRLRTELAGVETRTADTETFYEDKLSQATTDARQKSAQMEQEFRELQHSYNDTRARLLDAEQELADAQDSRKRTHARLMEVEQELASSDRSHDATRKRLHMVENELNSARDAFESTQARLLEAEQELTSGSRSNDTARNQLQLLEQELLSVQDSHGKTSERLIDVEQQLVGSQRSAESAKARLLVAERELADLQAHRRASPIGSTEFEASEREAEEVRCLRAELDAAKVREEVLQMSLVEYEVAFQNQRLVMKDHDDSLAQTQIVELTKERDATRRDLDAARAALTEARTELDTSRRTHEMEINDMEEHIRAQESLMKSKEEQMEDYLRMQDKIARARSMTSSSSPLQSAPVSTRRHLGVQQDPPTRDSRKSIVSTASYEENLLALETPLVTPHGRVPSPYPSTFHMPHSATSDSSRGTSIGNDPASPSRFQWNSARRQSLMADFVEHGHDVGPLLPDSTDPFVCKAREALNEVERLMRNTGDVHAKSFEASLRMASSGEVQVEDLRGRLRENSEQEDVEFERRSVSSHVAATEAEFRKLVADVQLQRQLSVSERDEIVARVHQALRRCEGEMRLLRAGPLESVPEFLIRTLVEVHSKGLDRDWDGGFSPMHWAAQHDRRDIMEYLLSLDGGRDLLDARDKLGRTPLAYALEAKNVPMIQWLREQAGGVAPHQPMVARPDLRSVPAPYLRVLEQVEEQGWQSVTWKDGYTMLHWAAEKGYRDICLYLVELGADVNKIDKQARTPVEYAQKNGHIQVVDAFHEIMDRPNPRRETVLLSSFGVNPLIRSPHRKSTVQEGQGLPTASDNETSDGDSSLGGIEQRSIPQSYVKVMDQIYQFGWDKMQWARGFTLLHWAAKNDRPELCSLFLTQGADAMARDDDGWTPFDYAREHGAFGALTALNRGPGASLHIAGTPVSQQPRYSLQVDATLKLSDRGPRGSDM